MLSPLSILYIIANVLAILLSIKRYSTAWLRSWPIVLGIIFLLQIIFDGFYQTFLLLYFTTVVLILIGFYKSKKQAGSQHKIIKISWGILWRLLFVLLIAVSYLTALTFGNSNGFVKSLFANSNADFTNLGWDDAFKQMHSTLEKNYAFGKWKRINWDSLYSKYDPLILEAEKAKNDTAYYLALREYVFSLPDGHVTISGNDFGLRFNNIIGGFGLTLAQLDSGKVVACDILADGPADSAGIIWGARILTWNNIPINQAIEQTSTIWYKSPIATKEEIWFQKINLLTRSSIGEQAIITFTNPNDKTIHQSMLTAVNDQVELYKRGLAFGLTITPFDLSGKPVEYSILPDGFGYLKINILIPTFGGLDPVGMVADAAEYFINKNVSGVIIDVRGNMGGSDVMVPEMMKYFVDKSILYERIAYINDKGLLEVIGDIRLKPASQAYLGPMVMLIDNRTISSGEGFPLIMKKMDRGLLVGLFGTDGSMGMTGSTITMPGDYVIEYPNGASLNESNKIQGDSDYSLHGGFQPDIKIPITMSTIKKAYLERRDVVLEKAIEILLNKQE